ncbi:phosphatidylinositol 4-kinase alpha 1-like isoform X3 [Rhodamnia argentea]|uniref:1-phosphatidylinositol 4-kinase n=1 Tax=Rhodamnia argentea TaxID=178133 RepID=A0A8B8QEC9_9MYRT|nr:phosphatidylinositol 4-kinase alpha 1-like isoform X3 [Rhodamnia argentea]
MEALIELCDLIARNPAQFTGKLAWICGRCPQSEFILAGSRRVSRSHLNAVLAVARFLSKSEAVPDNRPCSVIIEFLHLIPSSFDVKFWPQSFNNDAIASFFADFFDYLSKAADLSPEFAAEVAAFTRENVVAAVGCSGDNTAISRAFLVAISQNFPPLLQSDGDTLVTYLLEQLALPVLPPPPPPPREQMQVNSETWSAQSSPLSVNANQNQVSKISSPNEVSGSSGGVTSRLVDDAASASSRASVAMNRGNIMGGDGRHRVLPPPPPPPPPPEQMLVNLEAWSAQTSPLSVNANQYQTSEILSPNEVSGSSGGVALRFVDDAASASSRVSVAMDGGGIVGGCSNGGRVAAMIKQQVASFEEESVENLEKQEIAYRLITHILDKVQIDDSKLLEQVRLLARKQVQSMPAFFKIRKRDWNEHGPNLKARINAKLSVYQAITRLKMKSLSSIDLDGKAVKKFWVETLALLTKAAEACLPSVWRKLRMCEDLFSALLTGATQIAVTLGGEQMRVFLIRLRELVLIACAQQADAWASSRGAMVESVMKASCKVIEFGLSEDRAPIDTFFRGLVVPKRNDDDEQDGKEKPAVPVVQLNLIRLLADLSVAIGKSEVVDMILPLFIESLEEGDASTPGLLRIRLLDAVSRIASLGFEKSFRETLVLMTRSYLNKLSDLGSAESKTLAPEATTERVETLPAGFLLIASRLTSSKLQSDYRHRLLSLCSDVGLAAVSKSGRSGADFLGPLLPAVAEICTDFNPSIDVEPSLLKLFRNLWFYIALFGLAPPLQSSKMPNKSMSSTLNSMGSISSIPLQAVGGPYMWNALWSAAVQKIAQGTPPLVVSSVKWLEDELELNALHNPGSGTGSGNEKAAVTHRTALSAALGGRVDVGGMSTISGVKATYLLAVAFLEIIRFSSNGGILNGSETLTSSRSALRCVFEYLNTPNLMPAVSQCLTAIVHRAFETAVSWLEDRISDTSIGAVTRDSTLCVHTCFLIKSMSEREECIREIAVNLLIQLRDKFPQVLWNSSCLDSLLFSVDDGSSSALVNDPAWIAAVRSLYLRVVREWIIKSLSYAPCTTQGLLQERLCKANTWQRSRPATDVISLLSEIRIGTGKNDCWTGIRTANVPSVMAAAAAASGANVKLTEPFNFDVLSTSIVSATAKCNHAGEITGMRNLFNSIGGFQTGNATQGFGLGFGIQRLKSGVFSQHMPAENDSFDKVVLTKFIQQLQQFVNVAEKGGEVDKTLFRRTCSQATAFLLSNMDLDSKSNIDGFSQLLRLLCWCPAYISTADAMETGVFIWTWLVSAAPSLGSLVLAELVDAWLWTMDMKRGLFASEERYSGPAARLRPHLAPGEPEAQPESDPVEQIVAHRLWLGFFLDRFEVIRHSNLEQLLLLGRMLQGTTKLPWNFSRHPAATGAFFTVMLLGLKFCSCQSQGNLFNFGAGLQLLEDRIFRASLGWFAYEPEWHEMKDMNFAQSEAQSVSIFVHYLQNERVDSPQSDLKGLERENRSSLFNGNDKYHPVWGAMEDYVVGREKRKQLLLMLCQHETDRLEVWAQPTNSKEVGFKLKISSDRWIEYARTAFSVDPRIALSLVSRFRTNPHMKAEVTQLIQSHILDVRTLPEALPYFVTPKAVDENSVLLQQLPHWAACSITQALDFLTPAYKGHPRVMAYVLRVLESYPPERVTFFMPQLVQALRYDDGRLVEGYLLRAAQRSDVFASILIWHLQGEAFAPEPGKETVVSVKNDNFQVMLPVVREHIIDGFTPKALDLFKREFDFFDKVTSISGILFPLPKEERRAGIRRELEKIEMEGDDLYLPTAPNKLVRGIRVDSGIPLQSAAKVPIMITFNVVDRDGDQNDVKPQACIFKVGDDCRQDVLALQVISLLRDTFEAVGLNLYLFPYGVLPTGPERGIVEVVPNTRSRSQMGETTDGGLYEIFQQDYGPVGSPSFEAARENFIISSAGYAVASLLLQPKDRHNGNLLFDNVGRLVHIDFGFILETSPGGNMRFESAHFKLSHEMTQLLDPSGVMKSETWNCFVRLCVKGYLAARRHMDGIINTVLLMVDSGLPCFSRGDPVGNLRKRFHPEMSEREAANFMIRTCTDAYNKWTTAGYDLIQYLQQGIEK